MATCIPEAIMLVIKTRLETITVANGYENTVSEVIRPKRIEGGEPLDKSIFLLWGGTLTPIPENSCPGNPPAIAWGMPVAIAGILRTTETSTTAADTTRLQFMSDIIKALGDSGSATWHTFGGNALNSRIVDVEPYQAADGSSSGFSVNLLVIPRTDETNLFTLRA